MSLVEGNPRNVGSTPPIEWIIGLNMYKYVQTLTLPLTNSTNLGKSFRIFVSQFSFVSNGDNKV